MEFHFQRDRERGKDAMQVRERELDSCRRSVSPLTFSQSHRNSTGRREEHSLEGEPTTNQALRSFKHLGNRICIFSDRTSGCKHRPKEGKGSYLLSRRVWHKEMVSKRQQMEKQGWRA